MFDVFFWFQVCLVVVLPHLSHLAEIGENSTLNSDVIVVFYC